MLTLPGCWEHAKPTAHGRLQHVVPPPKMLWLCGQCARCKELQLTIVKERNDPLGQ